MIDARQLDRELERLRKAIGLYRQAANVSVEDALRKQAPKLGYAMRQELRGLAPKKGSVRQERLAALKAGQGIHIRASVIKEMSQKYDVTPIGTAAMFRARGKKRAEWSGYIIKGGKRLNVQALLVQKEINLRESGRGFTGQSSRFPAELANSGRSASRYGPTLGVMRFQTGGKGFEARLEWGGFSELSDDAVHAMSRARGQAAVARAIRDVTDDIIPYLERKLNATAAQMGLGV